MITKAATRRKLTSANNGELARAVTDVLRAYGGEAKWLRLAEVAQLAGMSVRSFQRKLSTEDVSFSGLVNRIRFELATEMLQDANMTVGETAERLGYFNHGDFSRAWKRWTGSPPQEFRDDRTEHASN